MDKYVDFILSVITQRFYLLSQLKNQGLSINVLNILFHALIVSRIVYALPAFSAGFLSKYNHSRINWVFRKGRKWRTSTDLSFNIEELIEAPDYDLFNKVRNRIHCLSSLLRPSNPANYMFNDLTPRSHDLSLPSVKKVSFKNSFIMIAIFKCK